MQKEIKKGNEIPTILKNQISYFDSSATTFMPQRVIDKWIDVNTNSGVSIGRGNNILSLKAAHELEKAEEIFTNFFNFNNNYDYVYTKNVTESINLLSLSLENKIKIFDIILVGPYEHHSNYLPWKRLSEKTGAIFLEIPLRENGELDYEYIKKYKDRIKVIAISTVSNTNGYYIDVNNICNIINNDTLLFVDQSQVTAHMEIIQNEKISAHFISSHKMHGPKNISLMSIKKDLINELEPVILGGGMVESVGYNTKWHNNRMKFFSGTVDISLIAAFAEACMFIKEYSYDNIKLNDDKHSKIIKKALKENGYTIINEDNFCVNYIISFTHSKIHAHDINEFLSQNNIIIRSGNICSHNSIRKLNINAINRISLGIGLEEQNIEKLCSKLGELANE